MSSCTHVPKVHTHVVDRLSSCLHVFMSFVSSCLHVFILFLLVFFPHHPVLCPCRTLSVHTHSTTPPSVHVVQNNPMNKTTSGRGARDDARVCVVSVVCKYVMSEGFDRVRMNDVWDRNYRTIAWMDRDAISTQLDPRLAHIEL